MGDAREGSDTSQAAGQGRTRFWLSELPYLVILLMTVAGAAYVSLTRRPLISYWDVVALASCAISIFAGWSNAAAKGEQKRLVWTQLLHWGAFLAVMNLVFLSSVQAVVNADSTSLIMLLLLALGTFVAGVHTASWRMGLNGLVMGLCVPAVAWLDQSALFVALIAVVLAVAAGLVFWERGRT